jgi:hypothetical protein
MGYVLLLAMTIHLAAVVWWKISQHPDRVVREPMLVHLLPVAEAPAPVIAPVASPPPAENEVQSKAPMGPASVSKAVESSKPVIQAIEKSEPPPSAATLLGSMRKYRLTDDQIDVEEPSNPEYRVLGEPPPGDVLLALQNRLPELPFGASGLDVAFYSSGFRGDLERFGDAITQEFGFKTRYGTKVQCVMMVVLLVCGWD